jgi:hypothetical protein
MSSSAILSDPVDIDLDVEWHKLKHLDYLVLIFIINYYYITTEFDKSLITYHLIEFIDGAPDLRFFKLLRNL